MQPSHANSTLNCEIQGPKEQRQPERHSKHDFSNSKQNRSHKSHQRKFIRKSQLRKLARNRLSKDRRTGLQRRSLAEDSGVHSEQTDREMMRSHQERGKCGSIVEFERYLKEASEQISCPVCKNEIIQPVVTPSNHTFCLQCIENCMLRANRCPLCREPISQQDSYGIGVSKIVQSLLSSIQVECKSKEYLHLLQQNQEWKKKRFISEEEVFKEKECRVDFWSFEGQWKQAYITDKFLNEEGRLAELLVSQDLSSRVDSEIIEFDSLRLARAGFYSRPLRQPSEAENSSQNLHGEDYERGLFRARSRPYHELVNVEPDEFILRPSDHWVLVEPIPAIQFVESEEMHSEDEQERAQNFSPNSMIAQENQSFSERSSSSNSSHTFFAGKNHRS